ncbi:MAG: hypothetical protein HC785_28025 [Calothrix sp. CSU_2_0]|nr:hypothetical protein [Calothrix sp. CSU_2_0]
MDSQNATQVSSEFESALSAILPEIAQLFQQYQVSGVLKAKLKNEVIIPEIPGMPRIPRPEIPPLVCKRINGIMICDLSPSPILLEFVPESLSFGEISKQDTEIVEKFWTDIASKLFEMETLLSQSIQKMGESFEVKFSIDTAKVNLEQSVVCQWDSNNILHYSKL